MKACEIIKKAAGKKVVVIGDIMLDKYSYGISERMSPEAFVPVIKPCGSTLIPGGAANVATNLSALGMQVSIVGTVGWDGDGELLKGMLQAEKIDTSLVEMTHQNTITKNRILIGEKQVCRIDTEGSPEFYRPKKREAIMDAIGEADCVIISDYSKGVLTQEFVNDICYQAASQGKITIVDPKPMSRIRYPECDLITPNWEEACQLAGLSAGSHPVDIGRALPCYDFMLLTMGERGMAVMLHGVVWETLPALGVAVDVSGCGDTVVAAMAVALLAKANPIEAAKFASLAASKVVSRRGTATVRFSELVS